MMTLNSNIEKELKEHLSTDASTWVLSALRQDSIVWACLQDSEFSKKAIDAFGADPEKWRPANLSLLALGQDEPIHSDLDDPALLIPANIAYDPPKDKDGRHEIDDLRQAGLIAIDIANHIDSTHDWNGILHNREEHPDEIQRLALVCLYGLVPEPNFLLQMIMSQEDFPDKCDLVLHIILSNPQPIHQQEEIFSNLIIDLPIKETNWILRNLYLQHPELASRLAEEFTSTHSIPKYFNGNNNVTDQVHLLSDYLLLGEIYKIAKQPEKTVFIQTEALNLVRQLNTDIAAQLAGVAVSKGELDSAIKTWQHGGENYLPQKQTQIAPPPELIINLLQKGYYSDVLALVPETTVRDKNIDQVHPSHLIAAAYLAMDEEDKKLAEVYAKQAYQNFNKSISGLRETSSARSNNFIEFVKTNRALVNILSDLSLYPETVSAAKIATSYQPNDVELLKKYATAQKFTGDPGNAAKTLYVAVSLSPNDLHLRRELINCLEENGDWDAVLSERCELLEERFAPTAETIWPTRDDQFSLAKAYLLAGQAQRSMDICQSLLQDNDEDGLAHAILGEAYMSLGDTETALNHLDKATQFSPHQAFSWLALARVENHSGNKQKALEILRAASHAVPTDPNILLSLAEIYLEQDEFTKALPVLQDAHRLVMDQNVEVNPPLLDRNQITSNQIAPKISLDLGNTLQVLGHHNEARRILSAAYRRYPAYRGLAYSYAKSLLSLKEYTAAIPPLVIAVQAEPDELATNLDYGLALLEDKTHPKEAVKVLSKALEISPENLHIKALLAEASTDNGDAEKAMEIYSEILESTLMDEPEWMSRISHGFGRSALALNKPEIAIASLQEAARGDPQNPKILQTLAGAYSTAELAKEAFETATTVIQLAPDDIDLLKWFSDIMIELNQPDEAISALSRALQLAPNNSEIIIHLGNLQSIVGKDEAAKNTYRLITSAENPTAEELLIAAKGLIHLGDSLNAIACLEIGIEELPEPDPEYLKQLALAQKDSNLFDQALETIEDAINLQPSSSELLATKTDLLVLLDRPEAAEASLEHAINIHPKNHDLHYKMVLFYRSTGQVIKALSKAEELAAMHFKSSKSSESLAARTMASELARALLQYDYATSILLDQSALEIIEASRGKNDTTDPDQHQFTNLATPYFCLLAEVCLEQGEEISAANYLTEAVKLSPDHPRVLALQSRFSLRTGDPELAKQTCQKAFELIELNKTLIKDIDSLTEIGNASRFPDTDKFQEQVCTQLTLAEAAFDLKQWEKGIAILKETISLIPNEPQIYLLIARALVLRAEYQEFCNSLNVVKNTPGDLALSSEVYQSFKKNLDEAEHRYLNLNKERILDESYLLKRWRVRGNAIFEPNSINPQTIEELTQSNGDLTTIISYISSSRDLTGISQISKSLRETSDLLSQHHMLLAQLARSLLHGYRRQEDYEEAMRLVEAAIHQVRSEPLYHGLKSEIAYKLDEIDIALESIDTALASWSDEPRWHALAAKFNSSKGDFTTAISHLKKASQLEPNHLAHHLALGDILQKTGDYRAAIRTLEYVLDLEPHNIEPYLSLAQAHLCIGEFDKAANYAQTANKIAPDLIQPLLVSAEIALQSGNHRRSLRYTKSALNIDPHDPDALRMQSHVILAFGRPEEALEILDQAINLSDKPLDLQLERADLLSSIQGSKVALNNLHSLALENPENPAVLYHLAKAMASEEQIDAAILVAQKALKCNTSSLNPKDLSQVHFLLGQLMRQAGQLDQSIHQLSESIQLTPLYLEPYLELGKAHQDRRQHALSLQTYQKAISIAPNDPRPYCQAGVLLKESHDYPGAENMLRRAADLAPDNLNIHRQLGALVALNIVHNRRAVPKA